MVFWYLESAKPRCASFGDSVRSAIAFLRIPPVTRGGRYRAFSAPWMCSDMSLRSQCVSHRTAVLRRRLPEAGGEADHLAESVDAGGVAKRGGGERTEIDHRTVIPEESASAGLAD